MSKTVLLAAAAAFALTASGASAAVPTAHFAGGTYVKFHTPKKAKMLYNQNSNYASDGISSQNFTSGTFSTYNDTAADDFVVPKKSTWTVTEVDVSGTTSLGGTPVSETVIFYTNGNGIPGKPVKKGTFTVTGTYSNGNIAIKLPKKGMALKAGTYWVSVAANMNFGTMGQWYWDVNSVQHGSGAQWQNPGGGFAICPTWESIVTCNGATGPDLMFDLQGSSKK